MSVVSEKLLCRLCIFEENPKKQRHPEFPSTYWNGNKTLLVLCLLWPKIQIRTKFNF
jgi:hypothetical protein